MTIQRAGDTTRALYVQRSGSDLPAELKRFDDIKQYYQPAAPLLLAHEAAHNLLVGICSTLMRQPDYYGTTPPYLALVQDNRWAPARKPPWFEPWGVVSLPDGASPNAAL